MMSSGNLWREQTPTVCPSQAFHTVLMLKMVQASACSEDFTQVHLVEHKQHCRVLGQHDMQQVDEMLIVVHRL